MAGGAPGQHGPIGRHLRRPSGHTRFTMRGDPSRSTRRHRLSLRGAVLRDRIRSALTLAGWSGHGLDGGAWRRPGRRRQSAEGRHHRRPHRGPDRQLPPDRQRDRRRRDRRRCRGGEGLLASRHLERVRTAVAGANVVVYLGHGNGSPSPYSSSEWPDRHNGWGLNRPPRAATRTTGRPRWSIAVRRRCWAP